MKRLLSLLVALVLVMFVLSAYAEVIIGIGIYYIDGSWYGSDYSSGTTIAYQDIPNTYKSYLTNYNFPDRVIEQDVSYLRDKYYGTPVGWFGITSQKGANLRTAPNIGPAYKGIQLHADTTVYVYFSFIDATNREWYYASLVDGTCGFLRTNFIQLQPYY